MEQFLRTYYTNLNPNATEEEILAFLESQGFGLGDQTVTGGIINTPNMIQDSGGDSGGGINRIDLPVGAKPPGLLTRTLATIFAPPVGIAMNLQALADQGKLPFGLNQKLGSRASGNVEVDLPTSDDPGTVGGSSRDSDTGGTFGSSVDDASTFSDYS
tara:strand:+ start:631 stop:1104 length:474 start_codon:yes stop_codon:yes gene_type:complete